MSSLEKTKIQDTENFDMLNVTPPATEIPMFPFMVTQVQENQEGYFIKFLSRVKVVQDIGDDMLSVYTIPIMTTEWVFPHEYVSDPNKTVRDLIPKHLTSCLKHASMHKIDKHLSVNQVLNKNIPKGIEHVVTLHKSNLNQFF